MILLVLKKTKPKQNKTVARKEEVPHRRCGHRKRNTIITKTTAQQGKAEEEILVALLHPFLQFLANAFH